MLLKRLKKSVKSLRQQEYREFTRIDRIKKAPTKDANLFLLGNTLIGASLSPSSLSLIFFFKFDCYLQTLAFLVLLIYFHVS